MNLDPDSFAGDLDAWEAALSYHMEVVAGSMDDSDLAAAICDEELLKLLRSNPSPNEVGRAVLAKFNGWVERVAERRAGAL